MKIDWEKHTMALGLGAVFASFFTGTVALLKAYDFFTIFLSIIMLLSSGYALGRIILVLFEVER